MNTQEIIQRLVDKSIEAFIMGREKKDNPRHIGMLTARSSYPIMGPSVFPSQVIFPTLYPFL